MTETTPLSKAQEAIGAGRVEDALPLLAAAADSHPEATKLLELLCLLHTGDAAELAARSQSLPPALQWHLPLALRAAGLALTGELEAALVAAQEALMSPWRPPPLHPHSASLAPAWALLGALPLTPLAAALEPDPEADPEDAAPAWALLGSLAREPRISAEALERAISGGLRGAAWLVGLARRLRQLGALEEAEALLAEARDSEPADPARRWLTWEEDACARCRELRGARGASLRAKDARRELRVVDGIFLQALDPDSGRQALQMLPDSDPGLALAQIVDDYLALGFRLVDSELPPGTVTQMTQLLGAAERGDHAQVLKKQRAALAQNPEDLALTTLTLGSAVALRGYEASLPLSQRVLVLGDEPAWALRQHAALLWAAGWYAPCLGTLIYLRKHYGDESLTPAAWDLLASCCIDLRHRPGLAQRWLSEGLSQHPGNQALLSSLARSQLWDGNISACLATLGPLLEAPEPSVATFIIALNAHLDGGLEGSEALVKKARRLHPTEAVIRAFELEVEERTGAVLKIHREQLAGAGSPAASLRARLQLMRTALRVHAYEEALALARETQTLIGEPDARCLGVSYEALQALEPGEERELLADMRAEARRAGRRKELGADEALQAQLSAALYLSPDLLEPLWKELATELVEEPKPRAPELPEALVCCGTESGCVALLDLVELQLAAMSEQDDWRLRAEPPSALDAALAAGRLAMIPTPANQTLMWLRLTTREPDAAERKRFRPLRPQPLTIRAGRLLVTPGEALQASLEPGEALALATELGGRQCYLPPGRYRVEPWVASGAPWPADEVAHEPCDVILRLVPGQKVSPRPI